MTRLVLYDSFFGNTEQVAHAVAEVLQAEPVRIGEVAAEQLAGLDLLVLGSPTRAFRPSPATQKLLKSLPRLDGVRTAAFDTRIAAGDTGSRVLKGMINLFGYAAEPIGRVLRKKGGIEVLPAEGFQVQDTEGPLKPGELERAREWARGIGQRLA